jgi:hypothetical protein
MQFKLLLLLIVPLIQTTVAQAQSRVGKVSRFDTEQTMNGKLIAKSSYLFAPQGVVFGLNEHPQKLTAYGLFGKTPEGNVRIQWFKLKGQGDMSEPTDFEIIKFTKDPKVAFQIVDHSDNPQIQSVTSAVRESVSQKEYEVWHANADSFLRKLKNDKAVAKEIYGVKTEYVELVHLHNWATDSPFAIRLGIAPDKKK